MDGTITRPHIDFAELRRRAGIPRDEQIIGYIEKLPAAERKRAHEAVKEVEMESATEVELNPGTTELLDRVREQGLKLGLITNNHRRAMQTIVARFKLRFDLLLSREDAPLKPAPDLLLLALERLGLTPQETRFVGDGRYDELAAQQASPTSIYNTMAILSRI